MFNGRVSVRLSQEEHEKISRAAAEEGKTLSDYIRGGGIVDLRKHDPGLEGKISNMIAAAEARISQRLNEIPEKVVEAITNAHRATQKALGEVAK